MTNPLRSLACLVFGLCSLSLIGCSETPGQSAADSSKPDPDKPYRIVTTCGMVTDIVRNVAGDRAEVHGLLGEGIDPHTYSPTRNDSKQLLEANVVFYSGLHLEGHMAEALETMARGGRPVYAVTDKLDKKTLHSPPEFEGQHDPHVWMNVAIWSECVGHVADRLAAYDPGSADAYRARATAYRAELKQLDDYIRGVVATVPSPQRVLVTAHDAFGYFSNAYEIPVKSVQGISTESEAGVNDINRLVAFLVERKIKALFVESSVSSNNLRAVIEGAKSRGWEVKIGGELFSDAMGKTGTYEGTYIGMMDHNATVIARALGGQAPEPGWKGKLKPEKRP